MKKKSALLAAALWISNAHAVDGVSLEIGHDTHQLNVVRAALQWDGAGRWHDISHYWELSFGGWHGDHGPVYDLGLTPVFRYETEHAAYLEGAIGFHVLSDLDVGTGAELSTRFQFGDHLGVGTRVGKYDWGVRLQ